MKVLAINGSPRADGNTAYALKTVLDALKNDGIETEMLTVGQKNVRGCIGCGWCGEKQQKRCVFDDEVNAIFPKMLEADGLVLGSPVYYSGINGTLKSLLDRAFYVAGRNGNLMRLKVGAGVVAARRSGGSTAFDQLNKYFLISEMTVVGSAYWNIIHGNRPGEAAGDDEGTDIMRILGRNMAWVLKSLDQNRSSRPPFEKRTMTNFVR